MDLVDFSSCHENLRSNANCFETIEAQEQFKAKYLLFLPFLKPKNNHLRPQILSNIMTLEMQPHRNCTLNLSFHHGTDQKEAKKNIESLFRK
ncbi:CLUMA_CG004729, isoform A [Clunio marinus]|uniref:CLUMA_CG004729, isoform A n=1 Tax=Clunio marinus TaxID=568069 RepID=A0A1J1HY25_9DIPT|nr:CLUMA_CG004729, isoform A [Clunio marinus]